MFSIGQLSRRTGVKVPTIRYYEQMGLMAAPERSAGNQRRYTADGLSRLTFIRHARALGFTIEDIGQLLRLSQHPEERCEDACEIAMRHLSDVRARIVRLQRLERELERITTSAAGNVATCAVLETLSDHALCETEH